MLLYDRLLVVQPSPVVELNRAVAVAMHEGPEHGLRLVDDLLDAHAPGLAELRIGQLDADPREDIVLDLTPHRFRIDQDSVHIEDARGDRPPHTS